MNLRKFIATGLAVFAALWIFGHCAACGALTPAEQANVASDSIKLSTCAAAAHMCKHDEPDGNFGPCWAEYDRCMAAHGFVDAGSDAEGGL